MNFILFVAVAGLVACAYAAPSADGHKKRMEGHMCLGKNLTYTDAMIATMKSCWPMKTDSKMKRDADDMKRDNKFGNMTCKLVCDYKGFGLISADGKVVTDNIGAFVKQVFPESVADTLTKSYTACVDQYGGSLEIKDGKCDSYQPMFSCIFKAAKENCKTET